MKLKEIRNQKGFKSKEIALRCGLDEASWSKIETYKFLPVPQTFNKICKELEVEPLEIYNRDEITLAPLPHKKRDKENSTKYNLCIFLPAQYRHIKGWIKTLGYSTLTEWILQYVKETEQKIKTRNKE